MLCNFIYICLEVYKYTDHLLSVRCYALFLISFGSLAHYFKTYLLNTYYIKKFYVRNS